MKEENNIDKLFRDKLEGFTEEPPVFIWNGIREQMAAGIRKKRVAWYRWSAVAALLILAFAAGWYFNETDDKAAPQVAQKELMDSERESSPDNRGFLPESVIEETAKDDEEQNTQFLAESNLTETESKKDAVDAGAPGGTEAAGNVVIEKILPPEMITPVDAFVTAQLNPEPVVKKELPEQVTGLSAFEKETINKNASLYAAADKRNAGWRMGVNVSPGYSSYSAKHGEIYASEMTQEATQGNASLGGGISIRYRTVGRWSVESGVYYAQNGQKTGSSPQLFGGRVTENFASAPAERLYFNTAVTMDHNRIAMNSTAGIIEFENVPAGAEISANLENTDSYKSSLIAQGELSQVFDMVEIPFYLRYLLVESKLDVELLGGINAGVVVGNNAFFENQFGVQKIGKTRDISTLNVSGTLGLGFTYALGKHFSLALEPRFNYYLNSISNNPEVHFKPYRIGMYTGLYYAF